MKDRSEAARRTSPGRHALHVALALLALSLPAATASLAGQRTVIPAPPLAPDYAAITTRAEAGKLVRKRLLVKIHFFPVELGGPNTRINTGYVTPEAALSHARLVESLALYAGRGMVDRLEIVPEYDGPSVVPRRIRMTATDSRGGDRYERVIEVWGCGPCLPSDPLPDPDAPPAITA